MATANYNEIRYSLEKYIDYVGLDARRYGKTYQQDFMKELLCEPVTISGDIIIPGRLIIDDPIYEEPEERSTEMDLRFPSHYTKKEGGAWFVWTYGKVDINALKPTGTPTVTIKDQTVHALAFSDPSQGIGKFPRWDCIGGWSTTFKTAEYQSPNVKHGLIDQRNKINDGWTVVE